MASAYHRLTSAQLRALGSGGGDAECLSVLRAGQADRRRLLLRAVAESAPAARPALELLRRVWLTAPEVADAAINRPLLGVWASRWLSGDPVGTSYLFGAAAAAGIQSELSFELISTESSTGSFMLPGLGTAVGLGFGPISVRASAGHLVIAGPDGAISLDPPYRSDGDDRWVVNRTPGPGHPFRVEDLDPYRACFGLPVAARLPDADAKRFDRLIAEAWQIIQLSYPHHAEAMAGSLTTLVPLLADNVSAASRLSFGAIGVCVPEEANTLALLMIHEFQHAKLGALLDIVELYNDDEHGRYWAPWRAEPRPIGALFQGIYAHVGVIDFWRVQQQKVQSRLAQLEFALWWEQTTRAMANLIQSGKLTEAGVLFVDQLSATMQNWRAELGSSAAYACAVDISDLAGIRFRLQNDQQTNALRPAPGAAQPSALATMLRQRFLDPSQLPAGRDPDVAYILGDCEGAVDGYQRWIDMDNAEEAWAGLALALRGTDQIEASTAIVARPEAVRALWTELRGSPAAVAAKLGSTATVDQYRS